MLTRMEESLKDSNYDPRRIIFTPWNTLNGDSQILIEY